MRRTLGITFLAIGILLLVGCAEASSAGAGDEEAARAEEPVGRTGAAAGDSAVARPAVPLESTTSEPGHGPDPGDDRAERPAGNSEDDGDNGEDENDDEQDEEGAGPAVAVVLKIGGIDSDFVEIIESLDRTQWVSLVDTGQLHLTESHDSSGRQVDGPPAGFSIQVEARAHGTPEAVADYAPDLVDELADLKEDELILSEASAKLRRLGVGASITFDNDATYRVAAVVADSVIGNSEVVLLGPNALTSAGASSSRRLAFVGYDGTGSELEQLLLEASQGSGVRVFGGRGSGDLDRQRTTLSSIEVKQIFGEFAFRPVGSSAIEIDPAWTAANLVTVDLPLLGPARCHRIYAAILTDVLQGLIDDGLSEVIDPGAFQGCWNPRRIAGSARLSKHSWGMAADINFGNSLDGGPGSPVNQELLDRMIAAGVISGHLWTATPDPGHFEYRGS